MRRQQGPPPEPRCPTCQGEQRETTNLVCQTCGRDYSSNDRPPRPRKTPAEIRDSWDAALAVWRQYEGDKKLAALRTYGAHHTANALEAVAEQMGCPADAALIRALATEWRTRSEQT